MIIVDSHCHLNFDDFKDDFDDVVKRAHENDVKIMLTICTKITEFDEIYNISKNHGNIYCSVGIHPCEVSTQPIITADILLEKLNIDKLKIKGFGETGLDYYHNKGIDKDLQISSFIEHIKAARIANLPVIVHCRDAEEDVISVIESEMKNGSFKFIIHCFTGTKWFHDKAIELGGYISVSGIVTFKNAVELQKVIASTPIEKMLVETDSPYLAPVPYRGKRNEPAYTRNTLQFVADMKSINIKEAARITTENFALITGIKI